MKLISILMLLSLSVLQFDSGTFIRKTPTHLDEDSFSTVRLAFVGDLMCHTPQIEYAQMKKDSFDFKPSFAEIKKYLNAADLTVGNLETTISGKEKKYSGYPLFNSPQEFLAALKDAGFDLLLTANNHSLDRGKQGILRTLEKIKEFGINSTGSFRSQTDRDSIRIFIIKGVRIAFVAYTYGLNGNYIPSKEKFLINVIDTNLIKSDILKARAQKSDVVVVYFHFGEEYQREPNEFQKKIADRAIDYGADIIIGSHPHVIQPVVYFNSQKNKIGKGIVAYSLGNFISNQRWRYSDAGVVLNISLTKDFSSGKVSLDSVSFTSTWVFKGKYIDRNQFVVVPADPINSRRPAFLAKGDSIKILEALSDTRRQMKAITKQPSSILNEKSN